MPSKSNASLRFLAFFYISSKFIRAHARSAIALSLILALLSVTAPISAITDAGRQSEPATSAGFFDLLGASEPDGLGAFPKLLTAAEANIPSQHASRAIVSTPPPRSTPGNPSSTPAPSPRIALRSAPRAGTTAAFNKHGAALNDPTLASTRLNAASMAPQSGGGANAIAGGAVVRHAPSINSGRVEGSVRQLLGEDVALNGGSVITGDLLVPGTPQVNVNGTPSFGGTVDGSGSTQPTGYQVTLDGTAQLGRLVRRTDPVLMPAVSAPPASIGTRDVTLNSTSDDPGDFNTLRDLTLNGNAGIFTIPAGTYRNFIASAGSGFILGVAGATQASVYNFAALTLNGLSNVQVVGPVVVTIGGSVTLNASMGSASNPLWLTLRVAAGGVTLNGGSLLSGAVVAPSGTVIINGNSTLKGTCFCDRLTVNGGGLLQAFGDTSAPVVAITNPCQNAVTDLASLGVSGTVADSTPTTVQVNGVAATQTAGTFSVSVPLNVGPNTLTAVATDLFNNTAQATRNVTRQTASNLAPVVNAGPDLIVILPGTAGLNGSVSDDGLPTCAAFATSWAKVSGPGDVTFSSPGSPVTSASFSVAGTYVLRLSSSDTALASSDDVTVSVFPPNQPPVVNAGSNQTITLPNTASLNGTVTDDGLPPSSTLTIAWSKVSGPGSVTFGTPNQAVTSAAFSLPGSYVLQFSASDTQYTSASTVAVTVIPQNQAPQVNAGPDLTITLPAGATLNGTATDDGLPQGSTLTITWSKVSGPGTVTFANPSAASTTASFGAPGAYVLRLSASDSALSASDDVTATVIPENQAPQVNAGPDLTITLPAGATLNGSATDDGLPPGSTLVISWTKVSGPGTVTFSNASAAVTTASFSDPGTYVLRLTASDSGLTASDDVTVTVQPGGPPPSAAFTTAGVPMHVAGTVLTSSGSVGGLVPANLLDNDPQTKWNPPQTTNQFVTMQFTGGEQFVGRVQVQAQQSTVAVKNFDVQLSQTSNDADFVTALSAVYLNNGTLQEFVLPNGPQRARFAKFIARDNYGSATTLQIQTFNVLTAGSHDSVVTLAASNNVARAESPSLAVNGGRVVAVSGDPSVVAVNSIITFNNGTDPWRPSLTDNMFVTIELAGGKTYTLEGIRLSASVKDFEVWVSTTTTDATAFTRVLAGVYSSSALVVTFLFPGGPVQARYVKYVPLTSGDLNPRPGTFFFDVMASEAGGVVGFSSASSLFGLPDRAIDSDTTNSWTSVQGQTTNQFIKIKLTGGRVHSIYGVRIQPGTGGSSSPPKDFDIRVSTTTSDDSAFTTVFSGTAQNTNAVQEFLFSAPVDAKYVEFFFKQAYTASSFMTVVNLEVLEPPQDAALLLRFSSQSTDATQAAALALDVDTGNGPWFSATGQNANQYLVVQLPGSDPWIIDRVVLEPGHNIFSGDTTVRAKNFDILVSSTDGADASFTTVLSGTLQNSATLQEFNITPVAARFIKLLLKDNYGSASQIALYNFFAVSPQMGSTDASFVDRSTISGGTITSWSWDFGDGGTSAARDPLHTYAQPGNYLVKLTVTSNTAQTSSAQILYHAFAPLAVDFSSTPLNPGEGVDRVLFVDRSSPRLAGASRKWVIPSLGVVSSPTMSTTFSDNGSFPVKLSVGDPNDFHYEVTKPIDVRNLPPTISPIQGSTLVWGQTWTPSVSAISDPSSIDAQSLRCNWAFGDGGGTEISLCTATKASASTHAYSAPGLYLATLSAFDKDGGVTTANALNVVNRRPTAFTGMFADNSQSGSVTVSAKLIDDFAKTPLVGRTVSFALGGATAAATSDGSGNVQATLPYSPGLASAVASVSVAADTLYLDSGAGVEVAGLPGVTRCTSDSRGVDFWLMFPANLGGGSALQLIISGDTATSGTISAPGVPFNAGFSVQPGVVTRVSVPVAAVVSSSDTIQSKGIHVTSQAPISVYGLEAQAFASDGFMALPTQSLGTGYITLGYKNVDVVNASDFGIVATANNTTVTITPADTVGSRPKGVPYTITMNQGQTYQLIDTDNFPSDLTGTVISADKPITVYGGHAGANIPGSQPFANPIFEQLPPVPAWSRGFALMPSATRRADTVRVIASVDNTRVYFNSARVATLNRGQFAELLIGASAHIIADQPVMVAQYNNSTNFDFTGKDPSMLLVPGYNQFLDHYTVGTADQSIFSSNYINIVAPNAAVGSVTLDGSPVAASSFTPIAQSGFSGAQIPVAIGSHTLSGPAPFGVSVYGYGLADAYSFPGGMCVTSQIISIQMTLAPQSANHAVGTQGCVTASVNDLNNNPVAGVPVSFTVTGVNPSTGSAITGLNGQAQFCYTGNNPGSDLIRAAAAGTSVTASKTWGAADNQPPAVSAGPNQSITLPANSVTLNGAATDDGLPLTGSLTLTWSQVSGPAGVVFADPHAAVTTATFPAAGTYVLQLSASDTQLTSAAATTVVVNPAPVNQAPFVSVGDREDIFFQGNLVINGDNEAALVSGQIPNWTTVQGTWLQGTAANTGTSPFNANNFFYADSSAAAQIQQDIDVTAWAATINSRSQKFNFSAWVRSKPKSTPDSARIIIEYRDPTNSFVLQSLDSGPIVSTGDWALVLDVRTAPAGTGFIRVRLIATRAAASGTNDAYFDQVLLRALDHVGAHLKGIVTDDGLPAGSQITTNWTPETGAGTVLFEDPSKPVTTVVFDRNALPVLSNGVRLTASDSALTSFAIKSFRVFGTNQPAIPSAGDNQSIILPETATLSGSVVDDNFRIVINGDSFVYPLTTSWNKVSGPGTVTFSAPTQLLTTASFSAPGVYVLQLKASDTQYSWASDLTITVNAVTPVNVAPVVNAGMNQTTTMPYNTLTLNGAASDDGLPSGSHLIVSWSQVSGPATATFSVPNAVSTGVTLPSVGEYVFKLTASDGALSSFATVNITVNPAPPANQAPVVSPGPNQTITLPTNTVTLNGSVQDDGLPQGSTLAISWTVVSGPGSVTFSAPNQAVTQATFSAAGVYVLQLSASDTEFTVTSQVAITVNPETPPPGGSVTVHIDSPADGVIITSRTPVVATITGAASTTWTLEYSLDADEDLLTRTWTTLASGTGPVPSSTIGTFDPTLLLNGSYLIRLTGRDGGGNPSVDQIAVTVRGQQKIGNFTLSFNDLTVPVAGLPIQVIRTYDSRDKRPGDFGTGWTLGIKNVRLEKSGTLGKLWDETVTPGILPKYCLEPTHPKTVTITFPDGKQYRFNAVPTPQCQLAAPISQADMTYVQISGDSGTSGASLAALGNTAVIVDAAVPGLVNLVNVTDQRIYNPTRFQLTTAEKYVYVIDQKLGVTSMTDPNGNTLTINSNGIIHSSGKSIVFTRDASGRITKITDPAGNTLNYSINAAGDLVGFTDREGNTTNFNYNATHGLLGITDPRGIQPIRNDYDADGRLVSHTDAFGKTITYTHNIAANHEEITDRLGHTTVFEYDDRGNVLRLTDAMSNLTSYTYDDHDNKLTETNALGKTTTYTYDAKDNLLTATDPLNNTTRYTYNDLRQVLTVTDPKNSLATNVYEFNGNLSSTKDALNNMTSFTYDSRGLRSTMTDPLNNLTRYFYDGSGNIASEIDALGHSTGLSYDANGNRTSQTTNRTLASGAIESVVSTFEYDKQNRLLKTIYPDGTSTQVVYNSIGQQISTIDQLGRQTSFEYDDMGRMVRATYPDLTSESSTFDAEGRRLTSTDRAGRTTSFDYDELGRLKKTTYIDGSFTTTQYDAIGRVLSTTDALNHTTSYGYDPNCGCGGRRTSITDALNHVTQFAFDANGNQSSMTDASGHTMSYEYDTLNRRTKLIYHDSTFDQTNYDALGRVASKTDQAGKTTQYGYDALGRLTSVTDALNQITRYGYDELGEQLTQTDALSRVTKFEYDKLGRRTKRTLPLGQVETYSYNSAGNLISRRDFNGKTTTYSYDSMNRLLSKTPDASFVAPAVAFTYSATGRRLTMSDVSGVTTYGYDSRDRLISKATPQGTLSYSYDSTSNLLSLQSSNTNGVSVSYGYDELNRLKTVTDNAPAIPSATNPRPATGVTTYRYDDVGNLAGYLYPNGVDTSYQYNSLNRLTSMSISKASSPLASCAYDLGPAGNRTAVTELSGRHVDYTYDELYRLKSETIGLDPVTANNGAISYNYDAVGNRLSRTSTVAAIPNQTPSVDANDRLTSDAYDANGNTTASAGKAYIYDFENRIKSVNNGEITFVSDGDGNRVAKTVGGVTTKFVVDTNNPTGYAQVVEEIVGGSVQRAYVHGHSLISQTQLISGSWTASFYGFDGHGSVRFLTDSNGAIADAYTFDAFGNLIASIGTTPNNFLYAGEQFDPSLGLYYLRARYANPASGRFHSSDTNEGVILNPKSLHKYLYANANPVNRIDPSGEVTIEEEEEVAFEEGFFEKLEAEFAAPAVRFWTFARIALTVGVIGTALTQQSDSHPSPSPSPAPSPGPGPATGTDTKTKDDEFKEGVNLDTGAAVAFGMITSTYGSHPDLANVITGMHGRQMFMTGTALFEFKNLLAAAGTGETIRSGLFLTHVTPMPDNPSDRFLRLSNPTGAKHENRAKDIIIFGTGDQYGMQTFTGDESFVNFLRSQTPKVELVPPAYIIKPPPRFSGL